MYSIHTKKNSLKRELQRQLQVTSHGAMVKRKNMGQFWRKLQRRKLSMSSENSQAKPKVHQVFHPRIWKKWGIPYLPTWQKSSHWYYKGKDSFQKHGWNQLWFSSSRLETENPDNFRTLFIQSPYLKTFMAATRNRLKNSWRQQLTPSGTIWL